MNISCHSGGYSHPDIFRITLLIIFLLSRYCFDNRFAVDAAQKAVFLKPGNSAISHYLLKENNVSTLFWPSERVKIAIWFSAAALKSLNVALVKT